MADKFRQKTADQPIGFLSEPQVEAGRLDLSVFNRQAGALMMPLVMRPCDVLIGENALPGWRRHRSSASPPQLLPHEA